MKSLTRLFLFAAFLLPLQPSHAQEKTPDKAPDKAKAKASIPVKVQILFTEMDGDKKVSSLPYSFIVVVEDKPSGRYSVNMRTGVRVPVELEGKDLKTTYMDVGANVDCGVHEEEDGKFRVSFNFERSALYPNKSADGERLVSQPNGQPLVRQFRTSDELFLRDGQSSDVISSTDPLNGHVLKISVTINVQK